MRLHALAAVLLCLSICSNAKAAGFAHNQNFIVYTPSEPTQAAGQAFAEQVLATAESFRKEIAKQWLGQDLPPGIGRTVINVSLSADQDSGITWARDHAKRRFHAIYITSSREGVLGSTLKHEMAHAILATQWPAPNRLPAWAEEGVASSYDDQRRIAARAQLLAWFSTSGNWPRLSSLLSADTISAEDLPSYAAAASLGSYLLSLESKQTFFRFAQSGGEKGWDVALRQYYGVRDVNSLQRSWQAWASKQQFAPTTVVAAR